MNAVARACAAAIAPNRHPEGVTPVDVRPSNLVEARLQEPGSRVHFLHLRYYPKPAHPTMIPVVSPQGGVTLAFITDVGSEGTTIRWAMAECSMHDNFVRRLGRVKAAGRIASGRYHRDIYVPTVDLDIVDAQAYVVEAYYKLKQTSSSQWANIRDIYY